MRLKLTVLLSLLGGAALALVYVALFSGPAPSHAQNPGIPVIPTERERAERMRRPAISEPRVFPQPSNPNEVFLMLDADGDGLLSFDEMTDILQVETHRWDVNGDRHIDFNEWNRYIAAVTPRPQPVASPPPVTPQLTEVIRPRFNVAPSPPPTTVSAPPSPKNSSRPPFDENAGRKTAPATGGKYPKNMPQWFKDYDADNDGQIALAEWHNKKDVLAEFKKYDLNDDGYITVEELVRSGQFTANTKAPPTVNQLQADVGDFFFLEITGAVRGTIWGTDVYTADSILSTAAVHAGVLQVGETGLVKVTVLAGQNRYEGTSRNDVMSQNFGMFPRSFQIEAVK